MIHSGCKLYQVVACADISYDDKTIIGYYTTRAEAEANAERARIACSATSARLYARVRVYEIDVGEPYQIINLCRDVWAVYGNGDYQQIGTTEVVAEARGNLADDFGPILYLYDSLQRIMPDTPYDVDALYHVVMYALPTARVNDVAQRAIIDELVGHAEQLLANGNPYQDELIVYSYESSSDLTEVWPEAFNENKG